MPSLLLSLCGCHRWEEDGPGTDVGTSFWPFVAPADSWRVMRTCRELHAWGIAHDRVLQFRLIRAPRRRHDECKESDTTFPAHSGTMLVTQYKLFFLRGQFFMACWLYNEAKRSVEWREVEIHGSMQGFNCDRSKYTFQLEREKDGRLVGSEDKPEIWRSGAPGSSTPGDFSYKMPTHFQLSVSQLSSKIARPGLMRVRACAHIYVDGAFITYTARTDAFKVVSREVTEENKGKVRRREEERAAVARAKTAHIAALRRALEEDH